MCPSVPPSGLWLQQDRQINEALVSSGTSGSSVVLRHRWNQFRTGCYQWGGVGSGRVGGCPEAPELHTGRTGTDRGLGLGGLGLGGLFALGPSDGLDGAQGSVEPGLLGGLDLIEGQTQMVLQVLEGGGEPSHGLGRHRRLLQGLVGNCAQGSKRT